MLRLQGAYTSYIIRCNSVLGSEASCCSCFLHRLLQQLQVGTGGRDTAVPGFSQEIEIQAQVFVSYQGVCGEFGWVGFLVVCFPYETNLNIRKIIYSGKKVAQNATFNLIFLGFGWPWVGEFIGFMVISICMFSNPILFGKSQTLYCPQM